jgi:phage shock protein PspC (stress-responsive transcriptional regulator)
MNKVITINLNGNAYPLEENGYEALRAYLDTAARRLEGNPDRSEIIADIEQAIADKFRGVLSASKTVVVTAEVEQIIADMGPVEDGSGAAEAPPPGAASVPPPSGPAAGTGSGPEAADPAGSAAGPARRLYRIKEGAMIAGVCNGIAAYVQLDVTVVRALFALLVVFTWGVIGIPLYIVLVFLLPAAHTSAEKAAAYGDPSTAEEFIRRAKEGYYAGMKTFHDKQAHREWKRNFKQEMRGWKRNFRREMRQHSHSWRQHWHAGWGPTPRPNPLAWIMVPLLSLAITLVSVAAVVAVLSFVCTGAVFGLFPPHGIPLWMGILGLIVAYHLLVWPLKSLRYFCLFPGGAGYGHGGGGSVVGLAFLVLIVWWANRHVPEVHQALQNLPPFIHQTVDSVRDWWSRRQG